MLQDDKGAKATPSAQAIEELLRFLPLFNEPGRVFVAGWRGGEPTSGGSIAMPFPAYLPEVESFFRLASQDCWTDPGYDPTAAAVMLSDDTAIHRASIGQIRTMLTYCVRGERFCDGQWDALSPFR